MIQPKPVEYPTSDGKPMAETEAHADCLVDLIQTLRLRLSDPERWHVHGNQLFYYVPGDPHRSFSPDVYVIDGVPQLPRRPIWKLWEEAPGALRVAFELTSPSSWKKDQTYKVELYDRLGVEEYVVYDVLRQTSAPPVRVWRRIDGRLVEVSDCRSEVLDTHFEAEEWRLRLVLPSGEHVLSPLERMETEADRAEEAVLWAETQERRADAEAARAEAASQRAEAEAERASEHASRTSELEAKLAAALDEIERLKRRGTD